jgi:deazaflavin-dependent oxidoreductase (nitroreductase family)
MDDDAAQRKRKRIRVVQRYLVNPPAKAAVWTGLVPGFVIIETIGRKTGAVRHNVVGMKIDGDTGWVIAEQGRHAGYVRNLEANPNVRVRVKGHWRDARAQIRDDDDPEARLDTFRRRSHEAAIHRFGTELLTIEFDFAPASAAE